MPLSSFVVPDSDNESSNSDARGNDGGDIPLPTPHGPPSTLAPFVVEPTCGKSSSSATVAPKPRGPGLQSFTVDNDSEDSDDSDDDDGPPSLVGSSDDDRENDSEIGDLSDECVESEGPMGCTKYLCMSSIAPCVQSHAHTH